MHSANAFLVTGATGFIGRYVVEDLVSAGKPVVVLARRRAGVPAHVRVAQSLGELSRRVDVADGDLADPPTLQKLQLPREVDTVVHCAGETSFSAPTELSMRTVQIEGPLTLLRTLADRGLRRWSHISTAYVCGRRSGVVWEHEGDVGQEFHNPYERFKLQAEVQFRPACRELGVGLTIHRPSIVIGPAPATDGGAPSNLFFTFIRMLIAVAQTARGRADRVRIRGSARARFNIVPVEYVASAIAELSDRPEAACGTFHLVAANPPRQNAVAEILRARLRLPGIEVLNPGEELTRPSPLELRLDKLLSPYREYLTQDVRFDDSNARRLLEDKGLHAPVVDPREIDRLMKLAARAVSRSSDLHLNRLQRAQPQRVYSRAKTS